MSGEKRRWFWRDTSAKPEFFGVDARAAIPFALFVVHMRLWTLMLAISSLLVLGVLAKFGYTVPVFLNMLKRKLAGNTVASRPWWYWERFLRK